MTELIAVNLLNPACKTCPRISLKRTDDLFSSEPPAWTCEYIDGCAYAVDHADGSAERKEDAD